MKLPVKPFFAVSAGLCAAVVTVALSGCASGPRTYEIRGEADPIINRDATGAPLSVVVRLDQLKAPTEFSKLTFDTLASGRSEGELLGPELLERSEFVLVPGATHVAMETLRDDSRYLGVVAYFRRPHPHYWRYLVEAEAVRREGLAFQVRDCYLILLKPKAVPIPGQPENAARDCGVAEAERAVRAQGETAAAPARPADKAPVMSRKPTAGPRATTSRAPSVGTKTDARPLADTSAAASR